MLGLLLDNNKNKGTPMKKIIFTIILLTLGQLSFANDDDLKYDYAASLCEEAFSRSPSIAYCKSQVNDKEFLANNVYDIAIQICKNGTGGAHSRGWKCFLEANDWIVDQYKVDLSSCYSESRYTNKFICAYNIFVESYNAHYL